MTTPTRGPARRLGRPPRGWVRKNLHIDQRKLNVARKALGVKRSQVELIGGQTSRDKRFLIRGLTRAELEQRLTALLLS